MYFADMHCDTIMQIWLAQRSGKHLELRDTSGMEGELQIDLNKMHSAGSVIQNFAIYADLTLPADFASDPGTDPTDNGFLRNTAEAGERYYGAWRQFTEMSAVYHSEIAKNGDLIREARTYDDIVRNMDAGLMSAVLTVEEGGVLEGDLSRLQILYDEGVRMMTLTWNYENELGYPNKPSEESRRDFSAFFRFSPRTDDGLKEKGREAAEIMADLGMLVDVSHLSDAGFYDIADMLKGPFVASHSNARAVCGCGRNMTDDMIRTVGEHGGVIGLNLCPVFLQEGLRPEDCFSTVETIAEHARHMINVGGSGVIGIGTDFDGIGTGNLEMQNAAELVKLSDGLEKAGFTYDEIEAVCFKNVLEVYKEVLR